MQNIEKYFKELSVRFNKNYFDFLHLVNVTENYDEDEKQMVLKAYRTASKLHRNQKRKSGEDYIVHPLNVAYILLANGFDYETVCAALLHDTVEDTNYTLDDVEENFNKQIRILVDGVTKLELSNFKTKEERRAKTHEKILESIKIDARIILIKLADRLHNLYTLGYLKEEKQLMIAQETNDFYVNLARLLGIYQIKDAFQDLALFYLNPDEFIKFDTIRNSYRDTYLSQCKKIGNTTQLLLGKKDINMNYNIKLKNIGGIYHDVSNGVPINEIDDLIAIRMILDNYKDCYHAQLEVRKFCLVDEESINDTLSNPKYNGYRSLNMNITYKDADLQLRIRTGKMQRINELGIVSNWTEESQKLLTKKFKSLYKENEKEIKEKNETFNI